MLITNTEVVFLERSIKYSGLPHNNTNLSYERAERLSKAKTGSGHDCFLKGVVVAYCLQADHSFWLQWQRYHHHDVVSSESKMHSILNMELKWNQFVLEETKSYFECLLDWYKEDPNKTQDDFEKLIMNCPIGLELKADIRSNYLQLKTIYQQRKSHKMSSWRDFCSWIETLPESWLITGKKLEILENN